jgi:1-aminocyclopropane-1-carboxylate deaminase/D-cysteine desulfhydrase-like pyridoxal-dependent ACC family enzyme
MGVDFDAVVLVSGSAGTHAGMLAGMVGLIEKGRFAGAKNLLFLHSGGTPALYVYAKDFLKGIFFPFGATRFPPCYLSKSRRHYHRRTRPCFSS